MKEAYPLSLEIHIAWVISDTRIASPRKRNSLSASGFFWGIAGGLCARITREKDLLLTTSGRGSFNSALKSALLIPAAGGSSFLARSTVSFASWAADRRQRDENDNGEKMLLHWVCPQKPSAAEPKFASQPIIPSFPAPPDLLLHNRGFGLASLGCRHAYGFAAPRTLDLLAGPVRPYLEFLPTIRTHEGNGRRCVRLRQPARNRSLRESCPSAAQPQAQPNTQDND